MARNAAETRRAPAGEWGATGSNVFGGRLAGDDYNTALAAPTSYDVFDKMRNDGQVKAALTVITLPILNASWAVEPASDSAQDREIAEFIEENLLHGMTISWSDYMRQVLLMLTYGSMPFEKVWRSGDDGLIHLQKLAPRLPKTVTEWLVDDAGGLAGVVQQAAPKMQPVTIPVEKLLVFVNDLEGSNFRGISVLRAGYKHWFYKDNLYRIQAIALEKRSLGVDVGTLAGVGVTASDKEAAERALMSLHAHEKQYMVEVEDQFKYRLEGVGTTGVLDPLGAIEHHDLRIVRSMIAEFVAMGAGSTGSLAMHRDKTSYLLLALGGHCNNVADTHNKHLIPQWVSYNWPNVTEFPRLRYARLEQRDIETFANAVEKLTNSGALTPDETLEEESRDLLSLPEVRGPRPEPEPDDEENDLDAMPTAQLVAARRAVNAVLRRRREAVT
jgi:phage gp29-like protein